LLEAKLELCSAYASGFYGGKSKTEAMAYIQEVVSKSKPVLSERSYSPSARYVSMYMYVYTQSLAHIQL